MYILILVIGAIVGVILTCFVFRSFLVGTLRIDRSDPDDTFLFLELSKGMRQVISKKYVMMKVKIENFIPRK